MIIDKNLIKEPKISIIITYYNLGKYIKDCVLSILNQEYQNFEIIIVNDCSNEENSKILSEIQNDKTKIINLKENKGQLLAFEEGLKVSQGEFICMIDADDILLPNYLKTLLYAHLNNNFALISCCGGEINERNEITSYKINSKDKIKYQEIKKIEIFKSISHNCLVGADIDIKIIYKNNDIRKIHLGTIIQYNKLINEIKEIARYKCIKFTVYE